MELERIYELNDRKVEVYFVADHAAKFNRDDFPKQGFYALTFLKDKLKGVWSTPFNRFADAESFAIEAIN